MQLAKKQRYQIRRNRSLRGYRPAQAHRLMQRRRKDAVTRRIVAGAETEQEVIGLIDQAIRSYNEDRLHSALDYQSPNEYINRIRKQEQQPTHSLAVA